MGVDVGGVLVPLMAYREDAVGGGGPGFVGRKEMAGAREGVGRLMSLFGGRVWLVSKCGPVTEAAIREWLDTSGWYSATGLDPAAVQFCRQRADKAGICAELGITHFVDDRLEVLSYMRSVDHRYLFQPRPAEVAPYRQHLTSVTTVDSWPDLVEAVTSSLPRL
jgi:hypothetical protein